MSEKKTKAVQFRRLGGSVQLVLDSADQLDAVLTTHDAHWAMTGIQLESMICDRAFLEFLDSDANGRIRSDEVRTALRWMLSLLKNRQGVDAASDVLELEDIDIDNPEGAELAETVRVALHNLSLPNETRITLEQITDRQQLISNALQNGDGIIPPDAVNDPTLSDCIRDIMKLTNPDRDLAGSDGVSAENVRRVQDLGTAYLAWLAEEPENDNRPFRETTAPLYQAFLPVRRLFEQYFDACASLRFAESAAKSCSTLFDPMIPESVADYLAQTQAAPPNPDGVFHADGPLNPAHASAIKVFFEQYSAARGNSVSTFTSDDFRALSTALAPYDAWMAGKNTLLFDGYPVERLRGWFDRGVFDAIQTLIENDKSVAKNLAQCKSVQNLILCQKNMLNFLNNYVTMARLFDPAHPSMIQAGTLVMDGRMFTLCTMVNNITEHKKIAGNSNICILYLDISTGVGPSAKTMKLAVAVTSGNMRNLFVGKCGVFFTDNKQEWDAKVIDFIQQPVSISEAVRMPFVKFGEFIQKQADRFFSARSKTYEDTLSKDIQQNASVIPGQAPSAPLPAQSAVAVSQTPAFSGSMLLMGGGVGIAAIGSSVAFIAGTLREIRVSQILAVFLGILLIFGGPIILVSMIKLFNRNLSIFLEANGYAINNPMRMSLHLGRFFTFTPKRVGRVRFFHDNIFRDAMMSLEKERIGRNRRILLFFVLFLAALIVVFAIRREDFFLIVRYWVPSR